MPAPFALAYASPCRNCQKLLLARAVLNIMDMQRKPFGQSAPGRDNGARAVVTVDLPLPYEGIGNALRTSFRASRSDLPSDMLNLLGKLDSM